MVEYQEYAALQASADSDKRAQAARIVARAYLEHDGPQSEHAALYAGLLSYLDDPSVRVRAALAYELLHASDAPRPIMFALAQDAPIIASAVLQYSPVLTDTDLMFVIKQADDELVHAAARREKLSRRVVGALIEREERAIDLMIVRKQHSDIADYQLLELAERWTEDAVFRGLLLDRNDLPAVARFLLAEKVSEELADLRMVKGSIAPGRLKRFMRDLMDDAKAALAEYELDEGQEQFLDVLIDSGRVNTRLMLHTLVSGRVLVFVALVSRMSGVSRRRVASVLESGGRHSLNALLAKCSFVPAMRNVLIRIILNARQVDLAHDLAGRHGLVAGIIEELIVEHDGDVPEDLRAVFSYLNEQNVTLARKAARGVMRSFIDQGASDRSMQLSSLRDHRRALPAA